MTKKKPVEDARVTAVRPTHDKTGDSTRGMRLNRRDTLQVTYRLDVLGADLWADREAAVEMYAQMAAARVREMLSPIGVHE